MALDLDRVSAAAELRKKYHLQSRGAMWRDVMARGDAALERPHTRTEGLRLGGSGELPRTRQSMMHSGSTNVASPRESTTMRMKRVKAACGSMRSLTDVWKKPEISCAGDLWNSFALRGNIGGRDQLTDEASFYNGMTLYRNGKVQAAINVWEKSRLQLLVRGDRHGVARTMMVICGYLGDAYCRMVGKYHHAIEFHINKLNFGEEIRYQCGKDFVMSESHEAAIALLPAVGHAQMPSTGTSKSTAIDYHRQRMEFARHCKDNVGEVEAARGLGHTVRWFDSHEESLAEWEEALRAAQKVGDYKKACELMERIGGTHLTEHRVQEAISWFRKSLADATKHGDHQCMAAASTSLGSAYRSIGKVLKAITCHEGAVSSLHKVGDRASLGKAYLELSADYHALLPSKYKYGIGRLGSKDKSVITLPWGGDMH